MRFVVEIRELVYVVVDLSTKELAVDGVFFERVQAERVASALNKLLEEFENG